MGIKQTLFNNLKNIPGWRTSRKLVAISVDDYGNVRLDSKAAKERLEKKGVQAMGRFDAYDTLATNQDLEMLFETLRQVRDTKGRPAVFTPYALPCNIDFAATTAEGRYVPESLKKTWSRLESEQPDAYAGIRNLWQEGIDEGIFIPQFHGREHFNAKLFHAYLQEKDPIVLNNLEEKSLIGLPPRTDMPHISFTQTYAFEEEDEVEGHKEMLKDGLGRFTEVFGYATTAFTPPAQQLHPKLYPFLESIGVKAIDKPFLTRRHYGSGKFKREWNTLGQKKGQNHISLVRNVVFEPTDGNIDHVGKALKQIEAAFRWGKPAHISSHRVNFCGHIDPENRKKGLGDLKELLQRIVKRWPEVEFVSVPELVKRIGNRE